MIPACSPTNVVGLVIQTAPGKTGAVRAAVAVLNGVEIHAETGDGRLVATAIDTGDCMAIDQLAAINRLPGVVSAMLAYHEIDHPEEPDLTVAEACCAGAGSSPCTCSSERI